jgi:hypothetical protein
VACDGRCIVGDSCKAALPACSRSLIDGVPCLVASTSLEASHRRVLSSFRMNLADPSLL